MQATGLAVPGPVASSFLSGMPSLMTRLDAVISVVDALNAERHLARPKEPPPPQGGIRILELAGVGGKADQAAEPNEVMQQIAFADMILLNKVRRARPSLPPSLSVPPSLSLSVCVCVCVCVCVYGCVGLMLSSHAYLVCARHTTPRCSAEQPCIPRVCAAHDTRCSAGAGRCQGHHTCVAVAYHPLMCGHALGMHARPPVGGALRTRVAQCAGGTHHKAQPSR
jgi:hypothetical protein